MLPYLNLHGSPFLVCSQRWIGTKGANQVKDKSGSYAVVVPHTDLKIISINTQYWMAVKYVSSFR